ncbi:2-oxoisovalerate dehydrogenase [Phormidium sp. FACHB-592]|uniref:2-oxoisovalerate dehydrogenase n=1 Tax=Stenomitos frigidus AS-A4 TaxID=2933935 RepID=A0ABV0KDH7_9CYAN|nr:2-oxoisovalerate dehydrogenase [Phormidium sp. FACHB-592]MBD2075900.1 2-oxoisovalerate dehydrogenase [Phormidium sp. FACHB-592]
MVGDDPEGGYVARVIGESIFTQADTIAERKTLVRETVQCRYPDPQERPKPIRLHSLRGETIALKSHAAAHNEDL